VDTTLLICLFKMGIKQLKETPFTTPILSEADCTMMKGDREVGFPGYAD